MGFSPDLLLQIVSRNPLRHATEMDMLPIIFFAILFGTALTRVPADLSGPILRALDGIGQAMVVIVGFAMRLAPFAVAALVFNVTALFG